MFENLEMFENEVLSPLSLFCGHYFGSNNKDANRDLIKCPIDEICTNKAVATVNLSTALLSREQTGLLLFLLLLTFIISSNAWGVHQLKGFNEINTWVSIFERGHGIKTHKSSKSKCPFLCYFRVIIPFKWRVALHKRIPIPWCAILTFR